MPKAAIQFTDPELAAARGLVEAALAETEEHLEDKSLNREERLFWLSRAHLMARLQTKFNQAQLRLYKRMELI